jgi:hypothetical protein
VGAGGAASDTGGAAVLMLVRISSAGTVGTSNSGSATGGTANRRGVQANRNSGAGTAPDELRSGRLALVSAPPEHLLDPLDNKLHLPV